MGAHAAARVMGFRPLRRALATLALTTALVPFPGGGAQAAGGGAGAGGLNLVPMDEVVVPIIEADGVAGNVGFKLVLETHDAAAAAKPTAGLPRLREATVAAALEFARLNASGL